MFTSLEELHPQVVVTTHCKEQQEIMKQDMVKKKTHLGKKIYKYDLLEQVQDEQTAVKLMKDVRAMCAEGSFHLTKFVSNIKDSLLSIPEEERRVFKIRN